MLAVLKMERRIGIRNAYIYTLVSEPGKPYLIFIVKVEGHIARKTRYTTSFT